MQVQLSIQHDFYGYSMFNGWFAKCIVLFLFPISNYIIHKATGNSYFITSQIDISQARPYSRFFILMHSILIIAVFINQPQCQNTTTITHQNEFVGFEIQSIITPFPRAFMKYCQHLICRLLITTICLFLFSICITFITNPFLSFSALCFPNSITTLTRHNCYKILLLSSITLRWSSTILFFLTM